MMKNKLGIFNVTLGAMLGSPMGINNSRIKYEDQKDKSKHFGSILKVTTNSKASQINYN